MMATSRAQRSLAWLSRLGGVVTSPKQTLSRVLFHGDGSIFDLFPWICLASFAAAPVATGNALLLLRVGFLDGLLALLMVVTSRMSGALVGAALGAAALVLLARAREARSPGISFDRALDACGYALVPYFLLMAVGAACTALGLELWFLPHRVLKGSPLVFGVRFLVGYGWPLALFGAMMRWVWQQSRPGSAG